jgi:hypothetical protein
MVTDAQQDAQMGEIKIENPVLPVLPTLPDLFEIVPSLDSTPAVVGISVELGNAAFVDATPVPPIDPFSEICPRVENNHVKVDDDAVDAGTDAIDCFVVPDSSPPVTADTVDTVDLTETIETAEIVETGGVSVTVATGDTQETASNGTTGDTGETADTSVISTGHSQENGIPAVDSGDRSESTDFQTETRAPLFVDAVDTQIQVFCLDGSSAIEESADVDPSLSTRPLSVPDANAVETTPAPPNAGILTPGFAPTETDVTARPADFIAPPAELADQPLESLPQQTDYPGDPTLSHSAAGAEITEGAGDVTSLEIADDEFARAEVTGLPYQTAYRSPVSTHSRFADGPTDDVAMVGLAFVPPGQRSPPTAVPADEHSLLELLAFTPEPTAAIAATAVEVIVEAVLDGSNGPDEDHPSPETQRTFVIDD